MSNTSWLKSHRVDVPSQTFKKSVGKRLVGEDGVKVNEVSGESIGELRVKKRIRVELMSEDRFGEVGYKY